MTTPRRAPRTWGKIRKLPSGSYQASHLDSTGTRRTAPATFPTRAGADGWLTKQHAALDAGTWRDPDAGAQTFDAYAARWLAERGLKPRTEHDYRRILDRLLLPEFGQMPLKAITPAAVRAWYARLGPGAPVMRAHAYGLLRAMLRTAAADDLIAASPCRIRGAGQARPRRRARPATLAELEVIAEAMPDRLRLMALLAAWCGLRFGELAELRRADVDLVHGVLQVRRGVVRAGGQPIAGTPKSEAGIRGRGHPAAPDADGARPPDRARGAGAGRAAVPRPIGAPPDPWRAVRPLLPGAAGGRAAGPAVPRPAAHRGDAGRRDRRDDSRADAPPWPLHARRGDDLPARRR